MSSQIYKIVVLGQGRVGKTCISLKYVNNEFDQSTQSTINASYLEKKIALQNGQTVKLAIWDTAGQQKYNALAPVYYRQALGAIVVYEIISRQSFDKMKKWVNELQDNVPRGIVLTIAGNKADLQTKRVVSNSDVQKFASMHKANHFIVSAKNGLNIKEMFKDISERIYKANFTNKTGGNRLRNNPKLTIQTMADKRQSPKKKKKECCQ